MIVLQSVNDNGKSLIYDVSLYYQNGEAKSKYIRDLPLSFTLYGTIIPLYKINLVHVVDKKNLNFYKVRKFKDK